MSSYKKQIIFQGSQKMLSDWPLLRRIIPLVTQDLTPICTRKHVYLLIFK